jgi:predicted kinase
MSGAPAVYRHVMRSSLIYVAMVVAAAPAAASPESDVEALVRTTVDHAADASSAASFTKGATVIGIHRGHLRSSARSATSFAWNATNLSRSLRVQLLSLFRSYRARTHVVYGETSPTEQELSRDK